MKGLFSLFYFLSVTLLFNGATSNSTHEFDKKCIKHLSKKAATEMTEENNTAFYNEILNNEATRAAYDEQVVLVGLHKYADLFTLNRHFNFFEALEGKHVLEVGMGKGRVIDGLTLNLNSNPRRITAIDINDKFVAYCTNRFSGQPKIRIRKGSVLDIPLKDSRIDVALLMWSGLSELNEFNKLIALKQLNRVLKPNGFVVLDVPYAQIAGYHSDTPPSLATPLQGYKSVQELLGVDPEGRPIYSKPLYGHFMRPFDLFSLATTAGFTDIMILPYQTDTPPGTPPITRHIFILHGSEKNRPTEKAAIATTLVGHRPSYNTELMSNTKKMEHILVVANENSILRSYLKTQAVKHGWSLRFAGDYVTAIDSLKTYGPNDKVLVISQAKLSQGDFYSSLYEEDTLKGINTENLRFIAVSNIADFKLLQPFGAEAENQDTIKKLLAYFPQPLHLDEFEYLLHMVLITNP